jgi:hypothetical protein
LFKRGPNNRYRTIGIDLHETMDQPADIKVLCDIKQRKLHENPPPPQLLRVR